LDSTGSGQGPVAGCCEFGDEPSGSCATELVKLTRRDHLGDLGVDGKISILILKDYKYVN
jgi:hypothetical protein